MKSKRLFKGGLAVLSALAVMTAPCNQFPIIETELSNVAQVLAAESDNRTVVDLNANDFRSASYDKNAENWIVAGAATVSNTINGVTYTLSNGGSVGGNIRSVDCKILQLQSLIYPYKTMDGVTINDTTNGGVIKLEISGLSAGTHSLKTWHSCVDNATCGTLKVSVNGTTTATGVSCPTRVKDEDNAGIAYSTFKVSSGQTVTVLISPETSTGNAWLNAFELDGADPFNGVSNIAPEDHELHWDASKGLSWTAGKNAVSHNVYIGTNKNEVFNATTSSSCYKGNQSSTTYALDDSYSSIPQYYWRVDEVDSSGNVTKGSVNCFYTSRESFPTAEGYGRFARGGRGGQIVEVTNLNDSGEGSLRWALCDEQWQTEDGLGVPRIVVFKVGGVIQLKSALVVPNNGGNVYIAGQTAPGDGITLENYDFGALGSSDVIIRDIHTRVGDSNGTSTGGMGLGSCNNCIVDHCSISWATDEGFSSRSAANITFQWSIIGESLHDSVHYDSTRTSTETHAFAASISGYTGSFHHNLLINNTGRNWSLAGAMEQDAQTYGGQLDIRNNVVYNWKDRTTDGGCRRLNFVGNYYKAGAESNTSLHIVSMDGNELNTSDMQMMYVEGNKMVANDGTVLLETTDDAWAKKRAISGGKNSTEADVKSLTPFFESYVNTDNANDAYTKVLANAGAGAGAQGLDYIDSRYIKEVSTGTYTYTGSKQGLKGIIDSQEDVGGYPNSSNFPTSYDSPTDSDHDGMPDAWETEHGLNPNDASDGSIVSLSVDDYTNVEMYLNELAGDTVEYNGNGSSGSGSTTQLTAATLTNGACYRIQNVCSSLYMTVDDNQNVVQMSGNQSQANTWRVVASPKEGYYYLYSQLEDGTQYCLNLNGDASTSGTDININAKNYKDAEQFMFVQNEDGSYRILPRLSETGYGVEVKNASLNENENIQQWELNGVNCQDWILEEVSPYGTELDENAVYEIQNVETSTLLSTDSGNTITGGTTQWRVASAGNGYYRIYSADTSNNLILMEDGKSASGTNALYGEDDGTSAALYKFVKNPDGSYEILTKASKDKCGLTASTSDTNVDQETDAYLTTQHWTITTVGTWNILGDINKDGVIDNTDLILLQDYLLHKEDFTQEQYSQADVNSDSVVTGMDLAVLRTKL